MVHLNLIILIYAHDGERTDALTPTHTHTKTLTRKHKLTHAKLSKSIYKYVSTVC